jgi:hypothetical protein
MMTKVDLKINKFYKNNYIIVFSDNFNEMRSKNMLSEQHVTDKLYIFWQNWSAMTIYTQKKSV